MDSEFSSNNLVIKQRLPEISKQKTWIGLKEKRFLIYEEFGDLDTWIFEKFKEREDLAELQGLEGWIIHITYRASWILRI